MPLVGAAQQTTLPGGGGWDGTADAVFSISPFTIRSNTSDGSDNSTFNICAGGACGTTRGAGFSLKGDDVGGAGVGGGISYESGTGALGYHYFYTAGTLDLTLGNPDADDVDLIFGTTLTTTPVFTFKAATNNGDDDATFYYAAGGDIDNGRGGVMWITGNEVSSYKGWAVLSSGNSTGNSRVYLEAGSNYWYLPYQASSIFDLVWGKQSSGSETATIRSNKNDGVDDSILQLTPGGSSTLSGGRGAYIYAEGADVSGAGAGGTLKLAAAESDPIILTAGQDPKGSSFNFKGVACELITVAVGSGAAGVDSTTNLCESGIIVAVGARVTQAPGGGATTFGVGCKGSGNSDQFISAVSTVLDTTGAYPANGDGTNTVWVQKTADKMTITTDSNVTTTDMKVRVCPYYLYSVAPTS